MTHKLTMTETSWTPRELFSSYDLHIEITKALFPDSTILAAKYDQEFYKNSFFSLW